MTFTLEFDSKIAAVRVALALEIAAEAGEPESHQRHLAILASVREQLGMTALQPCGCEVCRPIEGDKW